MVGRPDFPSILPVKSDRFFPSNFGPVHENLKTFIWELLKDFFLLFELVTKTYFIIKVLMSQMVEGPWFHNGQFRVFEV